MSGCQHPKPPTSGVLRTTIIMLTSDFRTDNRQPRIQTTQLSACLVQTEALGGEGEAVETSPRTGRRVTAMMRRKRHTPPQCTYRSRGLAGQRSGLQAQSTRLEEKRRGKRMERERASWQGQPPASLTTARIHATSLCCDRGSCLFGP